MSELTSKIDAYLNRLAAPVVPTPAPVQEGLVTDRDVVTSAQDADACAIRDALSGTFGEAIPVYVGAGEDAGAYLVEIPIAHLKACGLRMVESLVRPRVGSRDKGRCPAVTGSAEAVSNAERRVAKPLGEGWTVSVDSFPAHVGAPEAVYFSVKRA